jgi:hypothetical protein
MQARNAYQQGKAAQANHNYNAKLAEAQVEQGSMEARENVRRQSRNNESQLSAARARFANQGSIATKGAPLAMMGDIAGELELSVLDAYRGADANRSNLMMQAQMERQRGKEAKRAGKLMAISSILSTGAQAAGNIKTGQRTGVF